MAQSSSTNFNATETSNIKQSIQREHKSIFDSPNTQNVKSVERVPQHQATEGDFFSKRNKHILRSIFSLERSKAKTRLNPYQSHSQLDYSRYRNLALDNGENKEPTMQNQNNIDLVKFKIKNARCSKATKKAKKMIKGTFEMICIIHSNFFNSFSL